MLTELWKQMSRRQPSDPYAWAMANRVLAGRPLRHLPALVDIAQDTHPRVVIQKSAQVGLTELAVNLALWAADRGYAGRGNVLYLMPTSNQMDDFAQQRFSRAIQESPYLRTRLQPEPPLRKNPDNRRLKQIGDGYIFMRPAESRRQVASVGVDLVILDEYDQMPEGTLELAEKRLASSQQPLLRVLSTPRFPEAGVNGLYLASDQRRYHIPCPSCRREQVLTWEDNVDIERALVVCARCHAPMDTSVEGRWIAQAPGNAATHGYHLSRLSSPWVNIPAMIEASKATTPWAIQEFYNSDLGETHVAPNGGLHVDELDRCRADYGLEDYAGQPTVMGVDVGLQCHVVIRESAPQDGQNFRSKLWYAGTVAEFHQLDRLVEKYHVTAINIDIRPETQKATEFCLQAKQTTYLTDYARQEPGHVLSSGLPRRISANRTDVIDQVVAKFRKQELQLPRNARHLGGRVREGLGEYYREMMAPKRLLEPDQHNNPRARWEDFRKADHFLHAEIYCALAEHYGHRGRIEVY